MFGRVEWGMRMDNQSCTLFPVDFLSSEISLLCSGANFILLDTHPLIPSGSAIDRDGPSTLPRHACRPCTTAAACRPADWGCRLPPVPDPGVPATPFRDYGRRCGCADRSGWAVPVGRGGQLG